MGNKKLKKIVSFLVIILSFFLVQCSLFDDGKEEFIETYKEILIVRYQEPDSAKANKLVKEIIERNGYTEEKFKQKFFEYANDNPEEFRVILDSLRERIKREIVESESELQTPNSDN